MVLFFHSLHVSFKCSVCDILGGGSATASPQLKRRMVDTASQPKFFINLDKSKLIIHKANVKPFIVLQ